MGVRPAIWVNFDGQKYKELKNEERIKQQQQIVIRESAAKSRVFDLATFSAKMKVSLLNDYKAKEYFLGVSALAKEETNNAKALITPYALSKSDNELDNKNGYGRYWLRDLNMTVSAESLNPNGRVTPVSRDYKQYKKVGVRLIVQVVY